MKILLALILTTTLGASELPSTWKKTLRTTDQCKYDLGFWQLTDSPFGYMVIDGKLSTKKAMAVTFKPSPVLGSIYQSIDLDAGLTGLPTYTLRMTTIYMSSLPMVKISLSGVQYECPMEWVFSDHETIDISNVGSIGHE